MSEIDNNERIKFINNNVIDVPAFIAALWDKRIFIIKVTFISMVFGLFIALVSNKEFDAKIVILPEAAQGLDFGNIGNLASSFGIGGFNKMEDDVIDPAIYPDIVGSIGFIKKTMYSDVYVEKLDSTMTLYNYFNKHYPFSLKKVVKKYSVRLPYTILRILKPREDLPTGEEKKSDILFMSYEEWDAYENISSRINVKTNDKIGLVEIKVRMPEPMMVTQVANLVKDNLIDFLTEYKIEKIKTTLDFVEDQLEEAGKRYEVCQLALAEISDQNHGELTHKAQIERRNAQNDYDLAFKIYSAMLQKRDEVKLRLQENTPLIKVIEPAAYPKEKSAPRRAFILIASVFIGAFFSIFFVFSKELLIYIGEKFNIDFSFKKLLNYKNDK